jgi:uncharacterized RDD family membrane protein YckC
MDVLGCSSENVGMHPDETKEVNPYAPPSADPNADRAPQRTEGELAERGTRFVAKMLDGLMALALTLPVIVPSLRAAAAKGSTSTGGYLTFFRGFFAGGLSIGFGVAYLALIAFQAYLIATTGQSIGKRWFKIKIVRLDGGRVNFITGVLLRQWLFALFQYTPRAGSFMGLVDVLFIFRSDRRCIHDFAAGTKVIQLRDPKRSA